jgi:hypothetical protein
MVQLQVQCCKSVVIDCCIALVVECQGGAYRIGYLNIPGAIQQGTTGSAPLQTYL